MKRVIIFLVLSALHLSIFPQSGFFVKDANIEKWHQEGKNLETEIKKVSFSPEIQSVINEQSVSLETLIPYFHYIDFNSDGILDIIFNGKIGSQDYVFIFMKKGETYVLLLKEKGAVIQANLPNEGYNLSISVWHGACCGDYISVFTQFAYISTNDSNYFKTESKSLVFKGTILPSVQIETLVKCTVAKVTHLRTMPEVDNARNNSWMGNSLGIYSINATGTIYSEMMDSRNKYWYFVRMNNESDIYIHSNRFTYVKEVEDAQNCYTYGWIFSDDVSFEEVILDK